MNTREFNSAILVRSLGVSKEADGIIFDQIDDLSKRIEDAEKELKEEREKLLTAQADNVRLREALEALREIDHPWHPSKCPICNIVEKALQATIDTSVIEKVIEALELTARAYDEMNLEACDEDSDWKHYQKVNAEALSLLKGETK